MSGRIRSIKPEWLDDENLALLSSDARTLSVALILLADDYGNGRANPLLLRSRVFPVFDQSVLDVALSELVRVEFVQLYDADGQSYFHIRNWEKHQRVDKPGKPRVPAFASKPRKSREHSRESREGSKNVPVVPAPDLDQEHRSVGSGPGSPQTPQGVGAGLEPVAASFDRPISGAHSQSFDIALGEAAEALGWRPAPRIGHAMRGQIIQRCREYAQASGKDYLEACREITREALVLARSTGKSPGGALLEVEPGKGPPRRFGADRPERARATTGADFADAPSIEEQIKRLGGGT